MAARAQRSSRRHTRPRVLLALFETEERQVLEIIRCAHEWDWNLLDVVMTRGYIPAEPRPAGAIVDTSLSHPLVKRLRRFDCPIVRLGSRPHPKDGESPTVQPDLTAVGCLAAQHFAERGFEYVAYEASVPWSLARQIYEGFREEARAQGMSVRLSRMGPAPSLPATRATAAMHKQRARQIGNWLASLPKPVAILSLSASTLCTICHRISLAVPEEVALLGVGNHLLACELSPVPLSSVDTAGEEQARQAARLLRYLMKGDPAPGNAIVIPPRGVVTRRSTDVLAVADPVVARAMRFLWDNLDLDLSVGDIASQVNVSVRSLQRAFRRELGRGVIDELRRRRLQELGRLLRTSETPIADLAPHVGFRTLVHMHKCFRDAYGMTPLQYRARHRSR